MRSYCTRWVSLFSTKVRRCTSLQWIIILSLCVIAPGAIQAQTLNYFWSATTGGDWANTANWSGGIILNGPDTQPVFATNITSTATVTMNSNRTATIMTFSDNNTSGSAWVVSGSGTLTLNQGNQSTTIINTLTNATINTAINFQSDFQKQGNSGLTLGGSTANTVDLTKYCAVTAGTLALGKSSNTLAIGNVTVAGGILSVENAEQIHDSAYLNLTSGTVTFNGFNETIGSLFFSGGNIINASSTGLNLKQNDNSKYALQVRNITSNLRMNLTGTSSGGIDFDNTNNGTATLSGSIDLGGVTRTIYAHDGTASDDLVLSGQLSNGSPTFNGPGTVRLSGSSSNTFTGQAKVTNGNLLLNKSGGAIAIGGTLYVDGGTAQWLANDQLSTSSQAIVVTGTLDFGSFTQQLTGFFHAGGTVTGVTASGLNLVNNGNTWTYELRNITAAYNINLSGTQSNGIYFDATNNGTGIISGNVNLGASTRTVYVEDGTNAVDLRMDGVLSNGGITKSGLGTLRLAGSTSNTISAVTTVNAGTLELYKPAGTNAIGGDLTVNSGIVVWGASHQVPDTSWVVLNSGILDFGGNSEQFMKFSHNGGNVTGVPASGLDISIASSTNRYHYDIRNVTASYNINLKGTSPYGIYFEATNNGTGIITGNVNLGGISRYIYAEDGTNAVDLRIDGVLSNGGITKSGPGTLRLAGSGTNSISALTIVNAGTLEFAKTGGAQAISGNLLVNGGAAAWLAPNQIPSSAYVELYTGSIDFNSEVQQLYQFWHRGGTVANVPGSGLNLVNNNNGYYSYILRNVTANYNINLNGSSIYGIYFEATNNGTGIISGNVNLGGNDTRVMYVEHGTSSIDLRMDGVISNGGIYKLGAGTLSISGISANTFTGSTVVGVNGGTLLLNKPAGVNAIAGDLFIYGGTVKLGANFQTPNTTNLSIIAGGTYDTGGFRNDFASFSGTGGTINLNNGIFVASNPTNMTYAGDMTGPGDFTYAGAGILTLTGNNTQSLNTYLNGINGGGFKVGSNTALSPNAVYVMETVSGATLDINGFSPTIAGLTSTQPANKVLLNSGSLTLTPTTNLTFAGSITGTGTLNYQGTAVWTLSGNNTYTGTTNVNSGTLQAGSTAAMSPNSIVTIANGATLDLNNFSNTVAGLSSIQQQGAISIGTSTLTVNQSTNQSYGGTISGTGTLRKTGTGALTISWTTGFQGNTIVDGGTLNVHGALYYFASNLIVNNGGTLTGDGAVSNVIVNSGGHLAPINHSALNALGLTMNAGSSFDITLSSTSVYDGIKVLDGTNVVLNNATLNGIHLNGFVAPFNSAYTIIQINNGGSETGTFAGLPNGSLFNLDNQVFAIYYNVGLFSVSNGVFHQVTSGGNVVIAAIPEPTTWALIGLGVAGCSWAGYRRYRLSLLKWEAIVGCPEDELA